MRYLRRSLGAGVRHARPAVILGVVAIFLLVSVPRQARASSLRILNDNREALQARIDLIQQARHTIDLAYFEVDTSEVPIAVLELLRQASQRGVSVRLLVDGLRRGLPVRLVHYLNCNGIQVRFFHQPPEGGLRCLNRRLHSKLIVVDATRAIVGSRNLEDRYFGCAERRNFVDCDALVTGEVGARVESYFDWLWNLPDVKRDCGQEKLLDLQRLSYRPQGDPAWKDCWRRADSAADFQGLLDQSVQRVTCRSGVQLESAQDWMTGAVGDLQIGLLHDCRADKSERHFQQHIVQMLDHAACSILIVTPYPSFAHQTRAAISRAAGRGVSITIVTNSLRSCDQLCVYAAYQNQKRQLLRDGVSLREFHGPDTLHAKLMIVDGQTWMLGSHNFNGRSDKFDLEMSLVCHSREGAAHLRSTVEQRLACSTPIADRKLLLRVGHEGSPSKRMSLILHRGLVRLYRNLL